MITMKCDRCGKKIRIKGDYKKHKYELCVYSNPIVARYESVDLCRECAAEYSLFVKKAESYFMNNTANATDIFEKSKYYKE